MLQQYFIEYAFDENILIFLWNFKYQPENIFHPSLNNDNIKNIQTIMRNINENVGFSNIAIISENFANKNNQYKYKEIWKKLKKKR